MKNYERAVSDMRKAKSSATTEQLALLEAFERLSLSRNGAIITAKGSWKYADIKSVIGNLPTLALPGRP